MIIFNPLMRNSKKLRYSLAHPSISNTKQGIFRCWRSWKLIVRLQSCGGRSVATQNQNIRFDQWKNNYKMQLSSAQQKRQSLSNIPQRRKMMSFFGPIHTFGRKNTDRNLLPEKVFNERASDSIVEGLFRLGVKMMVLGVGLDELAQGVLIDIVVHLASDHALEQVESLGGPPLPNATFGEYFINDLAGLPLLLDEGQNQPDDVGDHVAVLQLL